MRCVLALGMVLASSWCFAVDYVFTKANNTVEWEAKGVPGFLRIDGTGGSAEGTLKAEGGEVSGSLEVAVAGYKTKVDSRDEHMHKTYFESEKYPKVKLVLVNVPYKEGSEFTWDGNLTIKKDTKKVKGEASVEGKRISAHFVLKISDFPSIGVPSWLGVTVADEVEVKVEAKL